MTSTFNLPMRFEDQPLLWTIDDVYAPDECHTIIDLIERSKPAIATNNPIYRDQDRVIRDDATMAADLFGRLAPQLPTTMGPLRLLGLNSRLRFYRYQPGQRFHPHMDHWYQPNPQQITLHTVLVYFNAGFEGGETKFYEQLERTVVPAAGRVAVFQHKIRHEGCPVVQGTKYAMRSDVIYESDEPIALPR